MSDQAHEYGVEIDPGEGPYADGEPKPVTRDGHTSNPERFTDSGFEVVPWTADRALRFVGVPEGASEGEKLAAIRDAIDSDRLPEEAVDALIAAGELPDEEPVPPDEE